MSEKTIKYETDELIVFWKPSLCKHVGACVHGSPEVFNVKRTPWIDLDRASTDKAIAIIDKCPSGALTYIRK
ncbi:MAG: (4Fe-4S)-binding protein [Peptostreptococcus sp.]|uniref:(4Fe-4S)-binding protein n=1 Tax=Peptostreptococcus sp. TaxID=1262 RepID=UPI002FCA8818